MDLLIKKPDNDAKSGAIIEAATGLFIQYGFSRVSMDDIAKAAGMSRPALYQYFRNKQDIYRAIIALKLYFALDMMRDALAGEGSLDERLFECIKHGILDMVAEVETSPHGSELIDMKFDLSGDLLEHFRVRKIELLAEAYREQALKAGLDPEFLANQLADWIEGMKLRPHSPAEREDELRQFIEIQMRALDG